MDLGQRNKVEVSGNMSTMTDLVFLLLIFFIILSTLASNGVNVDLPQSKGVSSVANAKLTVSIKPDLTYYVNGGKVEKTDLEDILLLRMEEVTDKVLYLQVDKEVPTGSTVEIIGLAKSHSWRVMLGSNPKKDE